METGQSGPQNPWAGSQQAAKGWGADSGWRRWVGGGDEGEHLTSLFVTLEALCTTQPKGNYL